MNRKNLTLVILSQIIFTVGVLHAGENAYNIQPGSQNNIIVIEVENKITGILQNLDVVFLDKPEWISIVSSSIPMVLSYDSTALITIVFNVESTSPDQFIHRTGNLSIMLIAGDKKLFRKTISLSIQLPEEYELFQNYPNPFNPTTQITFGLPKESFVTLRVYNALGQEVTTLLVSEHQKAGYVTKTWDGRNSLGNVIGSGMYFYHIIAQPTDGGDPFTQIKKMMIVK